MEIPTIKNSREASAHDYRFSSGGANFSHFVTADLSFASFSFKKKMKKKNFQKENEEEKRKKRRKALNRRSRAPMNQMLKQRVSTAEINQF